MKMSDRRKRLSVKVGVVGAAAGLALAAALSVPAGPVTAHALGGSCDAFMCGTNHNQVLL